MNLQSRILYEDNHLLVVNKLPGELSQGDKTGDPSLLDQLKSLIKERDNKPGNVFLGSVHRLDRPTSGSICFAKTSKALSRLTEAFRGRRVAKGYWAWIPSRSDLGLDDSGEMIDVLVRNQKLNKSFPATKGSRNFNQGKEARLRYTVLWRGERWILVAVRLLTGRHHQIRCQFAARGLALRGDVKYGAPRAVEGGSIGLHSRFLRIPHPTQPNYVQVLAPPPPLDLWQRLNWEAGDTTLFFAPENDDPAETAGM